MPSLAEIANQVNAKLTQIETHTENTATRAAQIHADTTNIRAQLATLVGVTQAGFDNLAQGLFAILETQRVANAHLATLVSQGQTIICWLSTSAEIQCKQLRTLEGHTRLLESMRQHLETLDEIARRVH